jgi:hypothetical protein
MHDFLSRDGMSPRDLLAAGRAEVSGYPLNADLVDEDVKHALADHRAG